MFFRKSPEKFWNLIATRYAASPIADIESYKIKIETLKKYLNPDDYVLDIGCGTGTQCDDMSGSVNHVTGIDISSKLLAIAEKRKIERSIDNVEFIKTTIFDKRFASDSFDMVTAFYVLHFFENVDQVIRRIHELLKPNGLFVLETACLGEKSKITGTFLRLFGKLGFLPLINILTTSQLEHALQLVGFSVVEKKKFSDANDEYTLIAKKL
jgi:ubiquinone/menaquinone biosynthesis C-methylase UbiE